MLFFKAARLLLLLFLISTASAGAVSEVTISTFPIGDDPLFVTCRKVMEEAYRRIGIRMKMVYMPGERSLVSTNMGRTDGELCRKKNLQLEQYKNLRMIDLPLTQAETVAFSKKRLNIRKWSDLKQYVIGYEAGVKAIEENTTNMKTDIASTMELGFKKLLMDRTEVYIDNRLSGLYMLHKLGYKHIQISPPLQIDTLHHYVNEKHIALVPKLNAVLLQMKKDGTMAKIERSMLSQ